ncbi:MAG: GtrA family protein [Flavobacteriia bacterium]|jgi:putative flippase GtrA|nr:GtrA family protein [Flavobacteriia bacterium]
MGQLIRRFLDLFHPLFARFFDKQTYYYAACGGVNLVSSWLFFFLFYQYLFEKRIFNMEINGEIYVVSAYTLSSMLCFVIAFLLGFLMNKFVVFTDSQLIGRVQLFRYAVSSWLSWLCSYLILKTLIEGLQFYPSIANVVASVITVFISYLLQRKYSFK